jgi:hypothetical protein
MHQLRIEELVKGRFFKLIVKILPIICFGITNILIFIIFNYFFHFENFQMYGLPWLWIYLIIGIVLSFCILKPQWLFTSNFVSRKETQISIQDELEDKDEIIHKIGVINSFLILIRTFFFNILNDLFISVIFWISFFFIVLFIPFYFGIQNPPQIPNLTNLAAIIGLIEVIAGLFQLYINSYRESVSEKVQNSLISFIKQATLTINLNDFDKFLDEECPNSRIKHRLSEFSNSKNTILSQLNTANYHANKKNKYFFININNFTPWQVDPILAFVYLDNYVSEKHEFDLPELHKKYNSYFNWRLNQFKNEVDKLDLNEIRALIFSNITFFDESSSALTNYAFESSYKDEEPKEFTDYLNKYIENCTLYLINKILAL